MTADARAPRSDVGLIRAMFALQPVVFGAWLPRLPQVQSSLDLSAFELAVALMGLPVGLLAFLFVGGRLAERLGTRRFMIGGHGMYLFLMPLPAFAFSGPTLFMALALAGVSLAAAELALNVTADRIEKTEKCLIMAGCHGFWSLGVLAGSVLGSAFAAAAVSPGKSLVLLALLFVAPILFASSRMSDHSLARTQTDQIGADQAGAGPRWSWPLLTICFFAFGIALGEGAMSDWAAIYLTDVFEASPGSAGLGYAVFAAMVATGRFFGDGVRRYLSTPTIARLFCTLALVGASVLALAPTMLVAFVGFALFGLGVSICFPLAVTAAGAAPGRSATANVALLSQISLCGFLVGPPVIGILADYYGMRFGFAALIPAIILSMVLTRGFSRTDAR